MTTTGTEWIIDAAGCRPEALCDGTLLDALCMTIIDDLDLRVVGQPQWHQFPGAGGWTAMFLLTESHLTIHTFPEHGLATMNLYCCRQREPWDWEARLGDWFGATEVRVRSLERGGRALLQSEPQRCEAMWSLAAELVSDRHLSSSPRLTRGGAG